MSLVDLSATGSRLRAKPRGYAGDYQTIDMIYDNAPAGAGAVGALIDACVLDLPALRAIRNRRRLLATEVLSSYRSAAKEFHVASLACGPAREVFDVFEKADDKRRLHRELHRRRPRGADPRRRASPDAGARRSGPARCRRT